jgi:hypothetical protein
MCQEARQKIPPEDGGRTKRGSMAGPERVGAGKQLPDTTRFMESKELALHWMKEQDGIEKQPASPIAVFGDSSAARI